MTNDSHASNSAHSAGPFLRGDAPVWYYAALTIIIAVVVVLQQLAGPAVAGWAIIGGVVATFTTAHKVFPLAAAGTLTITGLVLGLTSVHAWEAEIRSNLNVLLLIACMVPAIYFFRDLLEFCFSTLLIKIRSKLVLALAFFTFGVVSSAFFDALTVAFMGLTAIGAMCLSYESVKHAAMMKQSVDDSAARGLLEAFRACLRQLLMVLLVGTMCGGLGTLVGEPQNYQVGEMWKWGFQEYFVRMAPISLPVLGAGYLVTVLLEGTSLGKIFGYGTPVPDSAYEFLVQVGREQASKRTPAARFSLTVQAACGIALITALGLQLASIGLLGLITMIVASQLTGQVAEKRYVPAYHAAMPFFALLLVFFGAVSIIHEQHLFEGLMQWIASMPENRQLLAMYLETGIVSSVSDNVFVAVAHASNVQKLVTENTITSLQGDKLAIAIIAGTNIVSIATPNGQAAFLLTICSDTAGHLQLRYFRMLWMAVPYTVVLSAVGAYAVSNWI